MHGIVHHKGWIVSVRWILYPIQSNCITAGMCRLTLQLRTMDLLWFIWSNCTFLPLIWACSIFRTSQLHLCSLSSSLIWNVVCDLRLLFACISIAHYRQKFRKQALRTVIFIWFIYFLAYGFINWTESVFWQWKEAWDCLICLPSLREVFGKLVWKQSVLVQFCLVSLVAHKWHT